MPVTRSRTGLYDLDQTNTTRFLFGDDEDASAGGDIKHYQAVNPDESFPTLTRREGQPNMVSPFGHFVLAGDEDIWRRSHAAHYGQVQG